MRRRTLTAERAKLQQALDRIADAIAAGSDSPTLMNRLRSGERQIQDIERELQTCATPHLDEAQLEASLRDTLADWRGALRSHVPHARQMLRKLIVGKLVMVPAAASRLLRVCGMTCRDWQW